MAESLRPRLLLWYTAILALVLNVSGAVLCATAWRSRIAAIDATLAARAAALAGGLQPVAPGTFDLDLPPALSVDGVAPYHVLWSAAGDVIDRSDPDLELPRPEAAGVWTRAGRREVVVRTESGATVLSGRDLADVRREIRSLAMTLASVGVVALALSLAGGWWLVGRALAPVGRISRTARAMVDGDFAARIAIDRVETEFGQVARALNDAFDRLHVSLERQRRFTSDASHELRTPLTTVSIETQWALARAREPGEYVRTLETIQRAAGRMQSVVERLLALARAEAGVMLDRREPVAVHAIADRAVRDLAPLANRQGIRIDLDASPATTTGDPDRLLDALTNVVENAIQHSAAGGTVRVATGVRGAMVEIVVADTGAGIAPDDLPRVFEPFFRADPARRRDSGGAGLGLAMTKAAVEAHGGGVTCTSEPGRGTTIVMTLPAAV